MLERDHLPHDPDRIGASSLFTHPDDVLHDRQMKPDEKRALLAAWASDIHAVPNLPGCRQLDSGAIVSLDAILAALKSLDAAEDGTRVGPTKPRCSGMSRLPFRTRWHRAMGRHDDDDDPPPCPASALPPGVEIALRRRRDAAWALAA